MKKSSGDLAIWQSGNLKAPVHTRQRQSPDHQITRSPNHHRGSAFVATIWIIAALAGLTLVLGHSVRVESLASSNRLAAAQADAAEKGAEQFVLSAVDMEVATPGATATVNMEALEIGDAYVWIIKPDQFDETATSFGLTDEAGKLDINHATNDQLLLLPNITQENVDCILDWRDADSTQRTTGAEDAYYLSPDASLGLPPYHCKNGLYETLDELFLVKTINADLLFGQDLTRSGHVQPATDLLAPTITMGQSTSNRGIYPFLTIYGTKAGTKPTTTAGTFGATARQVNVNSPDALQPALNKALGTGRSAEILRAMNNLAPPLRTVIAIGRGQLTFYNFSNTLQWAAAVNLTSSDFSKVVSQLAATPVQVAVGSGGTQVSVSAATASPVKINVNTASEAVLMCIPGLVQADADAIVAYLQQHPNPTDPTDISWLLDTVPKAKLMDTKANTGAYFSGSSYCFSADILACSGDGRSFKRTHIVVDASTGASQIIYRRDLTGYGWPLDPQIRADLRAGKPLIQSQSQFPITNNRPTGASPL